MVEITNFIIDLIKSLLVFFGTFFESILQGLKFILSFFSTVPNFIYESTISQLPPFFKVGFYGVIGVIIFTIAIKIFANIKL